MQESNFSEDLLPLCTWALSKVSITILDSARAFRKASFNRLLVRVLTTNSRTLVFLLTWEAPKADESHKTGDWWGNIPSSAPRNHDHSLYEQQITRFMKKVPRKRPKSLQSQRRLIGASQGSQTINSAGTFARWCQRHPSFLLSPFVSPFVTNEWPYALIART